MSRVRWNHNQWDFSTGLVFNEISDLWAQVGDQPVYVHKNKELAICETMDGKWIVIADKNSPRIEASYGSFEEAFDEWSHA